MEVEIKKTVKAGNSSAVILPRAWLSREVRVELIEKTPYKILADVIEIARKYADLKEIIGIYLVGSHARGEESENSDIDILIITKETDRQMIKEGVYSILLVSEKLLSQKLENDLFPLGQMLKEAKAMINEAYLESLKVKVTGKNVKWYLDTTEEKLKLAGEILEKSKTSVNNKVVYTLVLRIRTLCIIQKLIKNQDYSGKEFIKLISKITGGRNAYDSYLAVKNDSNGKNVTSKNEAEKLHAYLKKQLSDVRKMI